MPSISVCIAHVYPERRRNFDAIVTALRTGSLTPIEIIVWSNDAPFPMPRDVGVIQAGPNPGPCARFLAALCAKGDYVLFQGTDNMVEKDTVKHLHDALVQHPHTIIGLEGRKLTKGQPYYYSMVHGIDGKSLLQPVHIDIAMGRMEMVSRTLVNELIGDTPLREREDDIWFSYAAAKHGVDRLVIPYRPGVNGFTNLPEGNVGNCRHPNHMQWRDDLCKKLFPTERGV